MMQTEPKKILPDPPKEGDKGCLTATILSADDLPSSTAADIQPTHVSMSLLGEEVKTGPPSARHRDRNSFKFVSKSGTGTNELSITAPLDMLYPQTAIFKVVFNNHETLVAECTLNSALQINQSRWLILNLEPESNISSGASTSSTPIKSNLGDASSKKYSEKEEEQQQQQHPPTLRLKICLSGPYRYEIAALVSLANSWFDIIDTVTSATSSSINSMTSILPQKFPPAKILLVPTVPIAAISVVCLPIVLGILTIGLPFFLPIVIALLAIASAGLVFGTGIYLSSSSGRESASTILGPILTTFCATTSGQRLFYETGPRPSPVALSETVLPGDMIGQLVVSLVIDFIGSSSYLLPGVGESFDLAWAPLQTILLMAMYDKTSPSLKYISFMEEILPFTDVLPSGTLGWVRRYTPLVLEEGMKRVEDLSLVASGKQQKRDIRR